MIYDCDRYLIFVSAGWLQGNSYSHGYESKFIPTNVYKVTRRGYFLWWVCIWVIILGEYLTLSSLVVSHVLWWWRKHKKHIQLRLCSTVDSKFHLLYTTHVSRQYTLSPYISIFYNGSLYIPLHYYYYTIYLRPTQPPFIFFLLFYFPDEQVGGQKREMMTSAFI